MKAEMHQKEKLFTKLILELEDKHLDYFSKRKLVTNLAKTGSAIITSSEKMATTLAQTCYGWMDLT